MTMPIVSENASLCDAVRVIETMRKTIAVVVDDCGHLLGTISDGDVRRALLAGKDLAAPVTQCMNDTPVTADWNASDVFLARFIPAHDVEAVPLLDAERRVRRVVDIDALGLAPRLADAPDAAPVAIVVAGGQGRRLRPLTDKLPKPMLEVGGVPLIERQVCQLVHAGITRMYISVGHLGTVIENHLGDGGAFGASIRYVREDKQLGTAGCLSLVRDQLKGPALVTNGDVVTTVDFRHLVELHRKSKAFVTVGAVEYRLELPYGVIEVDGPVAVAVREKPQQRFLCNAGIYVVSAEAANAVPTGIRYDMTDLIGLGIAAAHPVPVFPIHEYWADIGTPGQLQRARLHAVRATPNE